MMFEVEDVKCGGIEGLSFWSLVSSSEAATMNVELALSKRNMIFTDWHFTYIN